MFSFWTIFSKSEISDLDSLLDFPEFKKEKVENHFSGPRLDRWRYALFLYKNEYSSYQKLMGAGFSFTRKFAKVFSDETNDFDYPHNPLLSVLLYSGLIGLIAYFWFLLKAVQYYWLYSKRILDFWIVFCSYILFCIF